jgi:hypothetical protein
VRTFLYTFVLLFVTAYTVGAVGFFVLFDILKWGLTFGILPRMPPYQYEHPFQYVAVVAVPYGFFGALWVKFMGSSVGFYRWLGLIGMILGTVIISSCLGGMLWEFHDMQAGFFPSRERMIAAFEDGAETGLWVGPILTALSFPLNLVSLIVGFWAPIRLSSWLRDRKRVS